MSELLAADTESIQLLRGLFASATHDASVAVCRWTDDLIRLNLDEVRELPLADVCNALGIADQRLIMVTIEVANVIGGTMVLLFDEQNARRMVASLLDAPHPRNAPWTDMEKSALTETGNILACSYLNAITRLIDRPLVPTPPSFIQDYGASVVEQALTGQAMTADSALICRAGFQYEGEKLDWFLLFIPTPALRAAMERALT